MSSDDKTMENSKKNIVVIKKEELENKEDESKGKKSVIVVNENPQKENPLGIPAVEDEKKEVGETIEVVPEDQEKETIVVLPKKVIKPNPLGLPAEEEAECPKPTIKKEGEDETVVTIPLPPKNLQPLGVPDFSEENRSEIKIKVDSKNGTSEKVTAIAAEKQRPKPLGIPDLEAPVNKDLKEAHTQIEGEVLEQKEGEELHGKSSENNSSGEQNDNTKEENNKASEAGAFIITANGLSNSKDGEAAKSKENINKDNTNKTDSEKSEIIKNETENSKRINSPISTNKDQADNSNRNETIPITKINETPTNEKDMHSASDDKTKSPMPKQDDKDSNKKSPSPESKSGVIITAAQHPISNDNKQAEAKNSPQVKIISEDKKQESHIANVPLDEVEKKELGGVSTKEEPNTVTNNFIKGSAGAGGVAMASQAAKDKDTSETKETSTEKQENLKDNKSEEEQRVNIDEHQNESKIITPSVALLPKKMEEVEFKSLLWDLRNRGEVVSEGYFYKKREWLSCFWIEKYFVLMTNGEIIFLETDGSGEGEGNWHIPNATGFNSLDYEGYSHPYRLTFSVNSKTVYFAFDSESDRNYWLEALKEAARSY